MTIARRITVRPILDDARARGIQKHLLSVFPEMKVWSVSCTASYTIDSGLLAGDLKRSAEQLTNPIAEECSADVVLGPESFSYAIEVGFLPGVTDNVGRTAEETITDITGYEFKPGQGVYASLFIFLEGDLSEEEAQHIADALHNPLIERASVFPAGTKEFALVVPRVKLGKAPPPIEVDLAVDDAELERIGKEGIAENGVRRGPLALSVDELKAIRDYFNGKEQRKPTDVELESIAGTWSEHCKHTIFNDPLDEISEGIYQRYIKGATEEIRRQKGAKDFCVSVFKDNSGAIEFDKEWLVTHKVETHNSPSGLDPFGGSITAIVGVNRDALGFGLGAKPIANVYGFCVADPRDERMLYRDPPPATVSAGEPAQPRQPLLPARRVLEGLVKGINAGGNQSGIPTPLGFVAVDPSYRGKPLVFSGTVGLIPRMIGGSAATGDTPRRSYEKKARPGDFVVMLGGRVGADGIHGATFSSVSLSGSSPATAVQIGDPITQKKFSDALIREARDKGLYNSITDNGAGGLSGSVGEMARESGGVAVSLDKVPLKYQGLSAWQIWVSESQERMTLAVPQNNWLALQKICKRHGTEATRIGTFTRSGRVVVESGGKAVMNVSLEFLHDGRPARRQRSQRPQRKADSVASGGTCLDAKEMWLSMLADPSVGSIEFISRQYDHEVLAQTITKPLHGKGRVNADAVILQPLAGSHKGIVLSQGYCPWYAAVDTYKMAAVAIDTAVRNAMCAGADPSHLAILDNFCWSSSDTPERLYELKRAARACYDTAIGFGTPFISGKDSMFNDFRGYTTGGEPVHIASLPTLLVSALGVMPDIAKAQTIDLKAPGDILYVLGETHNESGMSLFALKSGLAGGVIPSVDTVKNRSVYELLAQAISERLVISALGLSRGGLAVALAKSAIAGQYGATVQLDTLAGRAKTLDEKLFSESSGRILISVRADAAKDFEIFCKHIPISRIGEVIGKKAISIKTGEILVAAHLDDLADSYRSFFKEW